MDASLEINLLALSYRFWYLPFHDHSAFTDASFLSSSQISTAAGDNLLKYLVVPRKDWSSFLHLGDGISIGTFNFLGSGLEPSHDMIYPKNGISSPLTVQVSALPVRPPVTIFSPK